MKDNEWAVAAGQKTQKTTGAIYLFFQNLMNFMHAHKIMMVDNLCGEFFMRLNCFSDEDYENPHIYIENEENFDEFDCC